MATSTDGLYHISVSDIGINIFTSSINFHNVLIWPDSAEVSRIREKGYGISTYINISMPLVQVQSISWSELISDKNISFGTLLLDKPITRITHINIPADSAIKPETDATISRLYAEKINIHNASINYIDVKGSDSSFYKLNEGYITLNKWLFEPKKPADSTRFALAETAAISFKKFSYTKTRGLYNISTGKIDFNSNGDSCIIDGFKLEPTVTTNEFYKTTGHQKDIFHVNFPSISLSGFNWNKLVYDGELYAQHIGLKKPSIEIFYSRMPPPNPASKLGKYPNQLLLKLKLPVNIDTVAIANGRVKYTEVSATTKKAGDVLFTAVNGKVHHATNIAAQIAVNSHCNIKLQGRFMDEAVTTAHFDFLLTDTSGGFAVDAGIKNLQAKHVTEIAQNLGLAEIKSLNVSELDVHIDGNQDYAKGNMTMLYSDMDIVLNKMNEDSTAVKKRKLLSFLAKNILLYPSNPMPGKEIRTATSYIKRDIHKSFFNAIWKNIYEGAKQTALRKGIANVIKQTGSKDEKKNKKSLWKKITGKK